MMCEIICKWEIDKNPHDAELVRLVLFPMPNGHYLLMHYAEKPFPPSFHIVKSFVAAALITQQPLMKNGYWSGVICDAARRARAKILALCCILASIHI